MTSKLNPNIISKLIIVLSMFLPQLVLGQGEIRFDYQNGNRCGLGYVDFYYYPEATAGTVTKLEWAFDDGPIVTKEGGALIPSTNYKATKSYGPGIYNVTLKAFHGSVIKTYTETVEIFQIPTVDINLISQSGTCAPTEFIFEPQVTPAPGTTIEEYFWDFGDGNNVTETTNKQVSHSYTVPGTYFITLVITDSRGCVTTELFPSSTTPIEVGEGFNASFNSSGNLNSCVAPQTIDFAASPAASNYTYDWDFGDGNTSTLQNPSNTYTAVGNYNVELIITNTDNGCQRVVTKNNHVNISTFTPDFQVNTSPIGCAPSSVQFQNISNVITSSQTVTWNFGDGTVISGRANSGSYERPTHEYAAPGTYSVTMTIVDGGYGCNGIITQPNIVIVPPPIEGAFSADKTSFCELGNPVSTVTFTPDSLSTGITSYEWDFGDGNTSTAINPSHTYTAFGSYEVTLTIRDANGCSVTITKNNYINGGPIDADFEAVATGGCLPNFDVQLTDLSTSFVPITGWDWEIINDANVVVATSTDQNPTMTLVDHGDYDVRLTITTAEGCTDTHLLTDYLEVGFKPDFMDFTPSVTEICNGENVIFTNSSTMPANPYPTEWHWDYFNAGTINNTGYHGGHTYDDLDPMLISVALYSENNGCFDTLVKNNLIELAPPRANFIYNMPACTDGLISFTNTSVGALSYEWEITIDGQAPYTETTEHIDIDVDPGTAWEVTLTASNNTSKGGLGCDHSMTADDIFPSLTPDFSTITSNNVTGGNCYPVTYDFDATAFEIVGTTITNYDWDFGNGDTGSGDSPSVTYTGYGTFAVTLEVTTNEGCTYDFTFPDINVYGPQVDFSINDTDACKDFEFEFTDNTTSLAPIVKRIWDMGDGSAPDTITTISETTYRYTYNKVSSPNQSDGFDVMLTVIDSVGCSKSIIKTVTPSFPVPDFNIQREGACGGENIKPINASSMSDVINPKSIKWTYSDGRTATGFSPGNLFFAGSSTGTDYTVTLELIDVNDCVDSVTKSFKVYADELTADFTAPAAIGSCPPFNVKFYDTSILNIPTGSLPNEIVRWKWDFGDGSIVEDTIPNPSHTYVTIDSFDVSLEVFDAKGCSSKVTMENMVILVQPNATFDVTPKLGYPGLTVNMNSTPIPDSATYNFIWEYGDATIGNDQNTAYTYYKPGLYDVELTVNKGQCFIPVDSTQIEILPCPALDISNIEVCPSDGAVMLDIFDSTHNVILGAVYYEWKDTDSNATLSNTSDLTLNQPANITTNQVRNIEVSVWVDVAGDISCMTTETFTVTFKPKPITDFTFPPTCVQTTDGKFQVNVENISQPQGKDSLGVDNTIDFFEWDHDEDSVFTNSNQKNVTFEYSNPGEKTITLITLQSNGCADTLSKSIFIPEADFVYSDPCARQTVQFSADSSTVQDSVFYSWDLDNDGIVDDTTKNPTFTYAEPGDYVVTLEIKVGLLDNSVSSCSVLKKDTITVNPTPKLDLKIDTSCVNNETGFKANGTIDTGNIETYQWYFYYNGSLIDSALSTTDTTTYTFDNIGAHTVTVTATSDSSCAQTVTQDFTVYPVPIADFNFVNACENDTVMFTDASTIDSLVVNDAEIVFIEIDFDNDGQFEESYVPGQLMKHAFTTAGDSIINYRVTSDKGCSHITTDTITIFPVPIADFDVLDVCDGETVYVEDKTNDRGTAIATYEWEFHLNDGSPSIYATGPTAQNLYASYGKYDITLRVTNNEKCYESITKTVTVKENPISNFELLSTCIQTSDGTSFQVTAENISQPQGKDSLGVDNTITSFKWLSNSAVISQSGAHATFTYPTPEEKEISLIVEQSNGCIDTLTKSIFIPEADFVYSDPCARQTVQFSADSSTVQDSVFYSWDLDNDGIVDDTTKNPTFTYAEPGDYVVTLEIKVGLLDNSVSSCSVLKKDTITVNPTPKLDLKIDTSCVNNETGFKANGTIDTGNIETYQWYFYYNGSLIDSALSTTDTTTYTFDNIGAHTVTVTATSDSSCAQTVTQDFTVYPVPIADFNFVNACENDTVMFTDASTIDSLVVNDAEIVFIEIDFDNDGQFEESYVPGQLMKHAFTTAGDSIINYRVTSDKGCSHITTDTITIFPVPIADFDVLDVCDGETVYVEDKTNDRGTAIATYQWDFGDGSAVLFGANSQHLYSGPGKYDVTLTVTNEEGCSESITKTVTVKEDPIADFAPSLTCTQVGDGTFQIHAKNTSQPQGDGNTITLIQWDQNNNNNYSDDNQNNITFTYTSAGEKIINLRVEQSNGCADTVSKSIYIPEADFDYTDPCSEQLVQFTDQSIYKDNISYSWDFDGDGNEDATSANPSFVYEKPGDYEVTLTIQVSLNSKRSFSCSVLKKDTITVDPTPKMNLEISTSCLGFDTGFKANGKIASGNIATYEWDFNDDGVIDLTTTTDSATYVFNTMGVHTMSVIATSDLGCAFSITQDFIVNPVPVADFTFRDACENDIVTFTNTSTIDSSIVDSEIVLIEVDFDDDGQFEESYTPDQVIEHQYLKEGTYPINYRVTSDKGCADIINKEIIISPIPIVEFEIADVCDGEFVNIVDKSKAGNRQIISYEWDFQSDGNYDAKGTTASNKYDTFGTYDVTLLVTNISGCQDMITKTVEVFEIPKVDAGEDAFICQGEFYDLKASSSFNIVNWDWDKGSQTGANYRVNPEKTTTYYVEGLDENGCTGIDSVTIIVIEAPDIVSDTVGCDGDVITFDGTINGDYFATYAWSTGETTPKVHITQPGEYNLIVHVSGFDDTGKECHFEHTVNVDYNAVPEPYPVDSLIFCFDNPYHATPQDTVINYEGDFKKIAWVEEEYPTDSVFASDITISAPGVYIVNVTNKNNCTTVDSVRIVELCPAVILYPNAFTPNKDNLNDSFRIKGDNFTDFELTVFNRWGEIIFQTKNQEEGWPGTSGGVDMPMGVYPFMVVYEEELYPGQVRTVHGSVTIIR
ncbi:PKD domain-containing protein [Flammeovirgaceae bacterium SG7u.111]|nr:PKD domain-containing protein [Flammeovirgaceae bacterium SG7u.132]WPO38516.1 PKD domain-containing protein [Flammeovirgaceae bacterium SG7u.111]